MSLRRLPARAVYININNPERRNALSLKVLDNLCAEIVKYNTPPGESQALLLPEFQPEYLKSIFPERVKGKQPPPLHAKYKWLRDGEEWQRRRGELPRVLILRSEGPVFSSGHDLAEPALDSNSSDFDDTRNLFRRCADLMALIRRSPIPVVGAIQGLATAAGAQLALATDLPVAVASAQFQLPGMSIGLPCTSPSTILSRKLGAAFTYRMFALAERVRADELPGGVVDTVPNEAALEKRVFDIADKIIQSSGRAQAVGKWAYWIQALIGPQGGSRGDVIDEYYLAGKWAAEAMAVHTRSDIAQEGRKAFLEKRDPVWHGR
ncbi:hypothetical protein ANO14919_103290 [Xylariales sp. No.14919]|nr:hypothetical protein ANO14919_103290 [Xylariales sp. No.14919]